jgi:hypothetical protein
MKVCIRKIKKRYDKIVLLENKMKSVLPILLIQKSEQKSIEEQADENF